MSFGGDRSWDDARKLGFVSAGGGKFYSQTVRALPEGARVWVNIPQTGYVGVGIVSGPAVRFNVARVTVDGAQVPLGVQSLAGAYAHQDAATDEDAERMVPAEWIRTVAQNDAYWEKGLFANQNSACKLRQEFTLERLAQHFDVHSNGE